MILNWSNDLRVGLKKISIAVQCSRWRKGSWLRPRWRKDLCSQGISRQTAASLLVESHFQEEPIPYSSHISDNPFDTHTENPEKTSEALLRDPMRKRKLKPMCKITISWTWSLGSGILIGVFVTSIRPTKQTPRKRNYLKPNDRALPRTFEIIRP
jgi:hypothetical protein